jgi:hypothetical protein
MYKKTISLVVMALVLTSLALPVVSGSTLTVYVYPSKNQAEINAVSDTKIIFTYPNNSTVSNRLNGLNYSYSMSLNYTGSVYPLKIFERFLRNHFSNVTLENLSIIVNLKALANSTTLIITKNMTLTLWLSGIFNKTKNTTVANMSWKDFAVTGSFNVSYQGNSCDLNEVGGSIGIMRGLSEQMLWYMFLENPILTRATIDYSYLKAPLNEWTKTYDSATNTTSFTYVYTKNISYNATVDINGAVYTLKMTYDPSATIIVPGHATASGDNLIITPTATTYAFPYLLIGVAAAVVVVIALCAAMMLRRK